MSLGYWAIADQPKVQRELARGDAPAYCAQEDQQQRKLARERRRHHDVPHPWPSTMAVYGRKGFSVQYRVGASMMTGRTCRPKHISTMHWRLLIVEHILRTSIEPKRQISREIYDSENNRTDGFDEFRGYRRQNSMLIYLDECQDNDGFILNCCRRLLVMYI